VIYSLDSVMLFIHTARKYNLDLSFVIYMYLKLISDSRKQHLHVTSILHVDSILNFTSGKLLKEN